MFRLVITTAMLAFLLKTALLPSFTAKRNPFSVVKNILAK